MNPHRHSHGHHAQHHDHSNAQEQHRRADHMEMLVEMRRPWLWTNFTIVSLGLWLISSPFTFGYVSPAMRWSDVISGVLLVFFAGLALWPRWDFVGRWSVAVVGVWLEFAPLVFWSPTPVAFVNDTLVGAMVIALSILVPMMPGMAHHMAMMKPGPEIPPGWTYNPSSWHQRAPLIGLALVGWLISRYLAAFQLGYIPTAWDPFFGESTERVLHSKVSRAWPVSDAGLGAFSYTFEFLMGWMGGRARWRTMPWMVTFFFILIVPFGITHIVLVMLQPVVVGYWCALCLAAAFVMLWMIPLMLDEVFAMTQFVRQSVRDGKPFWRTFWVGDTIEGGSEDKRTPRYGSPVVKMAPAAVWGMTVPWNLAVSGALGIWLMFAPSVFGTSGAAANSDYLMGALVVTVSVIAMAEVVRSLRFINIAAGLWLAVAPWLLTGAGSGARWHGVILGVILILISFRRGHVRERYGRWDHYIV